MSETDSKESHLVQAVADIVDKAPQAADVEIRNQDGIRSRNSGQLRTIPAKHHLPSPAEGCHRHKTVQRLAWLSLRRRQASWQVLRSPRLRHYLPSLHAAEPRLRASRFVPLAIEAAWLFPSERSPLSFSQSTHAEPIPLSLRPKEPQRQRAGSGMTASRPTRPLW